jgi:hypothetical protein
MAEMAEEDEGGIMVEVKGEVRLRERPRLSGRPDDPAGYSLMLTEEGTAEQRVPPRSETREYRRVLQDKHTLWAQPRSCAGQPTWKRLCAHPLCIVTD